MANVAALRAKAALALAISVLGASFANAADVRVNSSADYLKTGETWSVYGVSVSDDLSTGLPLHVSASVEQETRRLGTTSRAYMQASTPLTEGYTLEIGVGRGTGAAYGLRQDAHATLYTSVKSVELGGELHQTRYAASTVYRVSGYARIPLPGPLTAIAGASAGRSGGDAAGGFTNLGLEYDAGACAVKLVRYLGHRAEDPNHPTTTLDASQTYVAGLKCPLTAHSKFEMSANTSQAGALSGHGVSGALVIGF